MDCVIIRTLTTGEIDCNDLREKLCLNKDKPAIINLNIGSRNDLASIFMWYSLNVKGRLGLQQDVKKCLMNAQYLRDRLKDAGISSMLNEMSFVVVFERPPNPEFIKYWNLSCEGNMTHVIAMPHVTVKMLEDFVNDFVRERNIWYQCGRIQPPCLAEEIGTYNCCCSIHGKGSLQNGN
ncbi:hypothetical protein DH2020_030388 [Rehmannia glutinosa]|uniref:Serine decarboxylase n=1 Tax=Rehmannia glutinosa TaxID=99300 RepID=A0ABR0VNK1_REHGL